jgi:hypothetical protein
MTAWRHAGVPASAGGVASVIHRVDSGKNRVHLSVAGLCMHLPPGDAGVALSWTDNSDEET